MFKFFKYKSVDRVRFENLMGYVRNICNYHQNFTAQKNEALLDLIRIILKPIQYLHIRDAFLNERHKAIEELLFPTSMLPFGVEKFLSSDDYVKENLENFPVSLIRDVILPTNWHPSSFTSLVGRIGNNTACQIEFKQDPNHDVVLTLPMRIAFVRGGNHSISQGIIGNSGTIIPRTVVNLAKLYADFSFDGEKWIHTKSGEDYGTSRYPEFGWAWEIARHIT